MLRNGEFLVIFEYRTCWFCRFWQHGQDLNDKCVAGGEAQIHGGLVVEGVSSHAYAESHQGVSPGKDLFPLPGVRAVTDRRCVQDAFHR